MATCLWCGAEKAMPCLATTIVWDEEDSSHLLTWTCEACGRPTETRMDGPRAPFVDVIRMQQRADTRAVAAECARFARVIAADDVDVVKLIGGAA